MASSEDIRKEKRGSDRADRINMAVRVALLVIEIVSTLLREHLLRWFGP